MCPKETGLTSRKALQGYYHPPSRIVDINVHEARVSRLDLSAGGVDALVRASVHYYDDEPEVERFVRAVAG